MINSVLLHAGSIIISIWGIAHLFATKGVVKGFGNISSDNEKIITMEWIMEGITFLFIGVLVILVTLLTNSDNSIAVLTSAAGLFVMAIVSAFTGARVKFLPFRLCPFVLTSVSILYLLGTVV